MSESINNINKVIRMILEKSGKNQKEFAESIGKTQGYVTKLLNGEITNPSKTVLRLISILYSVNYEVLIRGVLEASPEPKTDTFLAEPISWYGLDEITLKIASLIKDLPEEERREFLRCVEEKKLLKELLEERKKLKNTG